MSSEHSVGANLATMPRRRVWVLVAVVVLAYALDAVTKFLVVAKVEGGPPVQVIPHVLYLVVTRNGGAAFGMATGMTWVFTLVAIAVVLAIVWLAPRLRSVGWAIGLGLVLAGALGNLTDRIFRSPGPFRGHVVDFISVFSERSFWPLFNVADSCITVGAVLIVLLAVLGRDFDAGVGRHRKSAAQAQSSTSDQSV